MAPVILLFALLPGCGKTKFDKAAMLDTTAHQVVHDVHTDFLAAATALDGAAATFCADRTAVNLDAARTAWTATKTNLKQVEAWSFGPYGFMGIELMAEVDKWPGSPTNIEALLASSTTIDAAWAEAEDHELRTKGYPAIEYLLWSDGDSTLARFVGDDRRCLLLTTLATHGLTHVSAYHAAWDPTGDDYEGALAEAGAGSDVYDTQQEAITDLVSGMLTATTWLAELKLEIPLGEYAGGVPQPDQVESPYADGSLDHAAWVLDGVETMYDGTGGVGLGDYVASRQASGDVDALFREHLADARASLAAIPAPLETAVTTDHDAVEAAIEDVDALSATISGELSTLLGVNPTTVEADND